MNARPVAEADLDALAAFLAEDEERLLRRPARIGVDDVRAWLGRCDLQRDSWVYEEDGRWAAVGWVEGNGGDAAVAIGVVGGSWLGRGLGETLLERSEARLNEKGYARIQQVALAADPDAPALLAAHGYREIRRFWEMTIVLDEAPPAPSVPERIRIDPFVEADAASFHRVLDEAFRDHWQHEPTPFEHWWERRRSAPGFDSSLWFVAREGAELVAAVCNDRNRLGGGWVESLGVLRPWRGRGLGRALLLRTFHEFHRRGIRRVGLGVDAENPTGATRLYETVGMEVELEQVLYEKELR